MGPTHAFGRHQVPRAHHRPDLGVDRVEHLGGDRERVRCSREHDPRLGLHQDEHREVVATRVRPASQLAQAVDEDLAVRTFVDLLHVEDLEALHPDRAPERSIRIGEHVELELADRLVVQLCAQVRVRDCEIGQARLDRRDRSEDVRGRFDVVAVVRPDDLDVVEPRLRHRRTAGTTTKARRERAHRHQPGLEPARPGRPHRVSTLAGSCRRPLALVGPRTAQTSAAAPASSSPYFDRSSG